VSFSELVDRLIELARERHTERARTTYTYDSSLLRQIAAGAKAGGAKQG
jgi:hypothetical protein